MRGIFKLVSLFCIFVSGAFVSFSSSGTELPVSYPIDVDVCSLYATTSQQPHCSKPSYFTWHYSAIDTSTFPITTVDDKKSEDFSEVVNHVLERVRNQGCPNCIVIDESVYNAVNAHNQSVSNRPMIALYYDTSSSSSNYYSLPVLYTEYTGDYQSRKIVIGTVEQSQAGFHFFQYSPQPIDPLPYQVIHLWVDAEDSFGGSPHESAYFRPHCESGGLNRVNYPWGTPSVIQTYIYWCTSLPSSKTDGASDLDSLKEGCAYGCNPVNLTTGAKMDHHVDYQNGSPLPIVIDRWYLSSKEGWVFSHARRLSHAGQHGGNEKVVMNRPDGSVLVFSRSSSSNPWKTDNLSLHILGKLETVSINADKHFAYKNLHGQTEFYNEEGQLTFVEDLYGNSHTYTYLTNELIKIEDNFSRFVNFSYTGTGKTRHLSSITDGDVTVEYDIERKMFFINHEPLVKNLLKEVTYEDGKSIQYHYDELVENPKGLMTGITKEDNERFATYVYDTNDKVLQTSHGFGKNVNQYHFDEMGSSILWGGGDAYFPKTSDFDELNKTAGSTNLCPNCGGHQASNVTYHSSGAVSSSTSHDGVITANTFYTGGTGDLGLPDITTKYAGTSQAQNTSYTWNGATRQPLSMVEDIVVEGVNHTRTTVFTYDTSNRLTQMVVSTSTGEPSRAYSFTYNLKNQVLTKTTPLGTTTYTYDAINGNKLTEANALGHQTVFSNYTPRGLVGKATDPNGLETIYSYDNRDRLTQVKRGKASMHWETVAMEHTDYGNLKKVTYPDLTTVEYLYDDAHRLTEIITPQGKMVLTLNTDGDVISETILDPTHQVTQTKHALFDAFRNLHAVYNASYTSGTFMGYQAGKLSFVSDPDYDYYRQETRSYDPQGRLSWVGDDRRNVVTYQYDKNDNVTKITDGNFVDTLFSYNGFGQLTVLDSPDGGPKGYSYNGAGLLSAEMDGRGVETTNTFDALGRTTTKTFDGSNATPSLPNKTQSFVYDLCPNGIGKLCQATDPSGTTSYSYDLWGRITQKTVVLSTPSSVILTTLYEYNNKGQLISQTYPSGKRLDYTYTQGMVSSIEYDFQVVADNIEYVAMSDTPKSWDWGHSNSVNFHYNLDGRLESITDTDQRDYLYNKKGWLLGITDPVDSSKDQLFSYNASKNLTQADFAVRPDPIDYFIDENDNIKERSVGPLFIDKSYYDFWTNYTVNNRAFSMIENGSSYTEIYDANGNITDTGKGLTVTYDATNRLSSSSRLGVNATYAYNFEGLRQRKSGTHLSTNHRVYSYDEQRRLLGVYDGAGVALEEYIYLDGFRVIAMARNISSVSSIPHLYSVLTDHLGTPRKVLDNTGNPVWSWETKDPYGYSAPNGLLSGTHFEFNLRFPGQTFDNETGLYHNGFRDYDPNRGRYIQPDPIGLQGGLNLYAYAESDPINGYDPLGLKVRVVGVAKSQAEASIQRLSNLSPTFRHMWQSLKDSEEMYEVLARRSGENGYGEMPKGLDGKVPYYQIKWNLDFSLRCNTDGRILPPESGLAHEVSHAYRDMLKGNKNRSLPFVEEFHNLKYERMIHMEMGWPKGRGLHEYYLSEPAN